MNGNKYIFKDKVTEKDEMERRIFMLMMVKKLIV